jgi:uncharacterized membrane protein YozB (DUF420 family)
MIRIGWRKLMRGARRIHFWRYAFLTAIVLFVLFLVRTHTDAQYGRYRMREHIPIRPPLFQELFSRGILNRKELGAAYVSYH